jgi:hypothetical protein
MITLAIAKPNKLYEHCNNFKDSVIQAVYHEESQQVNFYETYCGKFHVLNEELVKSLFPTGSPIKEQPFLFKENKEFCYVLFRRRKKFRERFETLVRVKTPMTRTRTEKTKTKKRK